MALGLSVLLAGLFVLIAVMHDLLQALPYLLAAVATAVLALWRFKYRGLTGEMKWLSVGSQVMRLEVDDRSLIVGTGVLRAEFDWDRVDRAVVTEGYVILDRGGQPIGVPLRTFSTPEAGNRFIAFVEDHVQSQKTSSADPYV